MAGKRNGTRAVGILMIAALLLAIYLQIRSDRNPPAAVIGVSSPSALPDSTSAPAEEVTVTRISHPTETRLPPTAHKKRAELEYPDYVCKGDKLMQYQSWTPQQITQDLIRKGKIPAGGSSQSQYTLITQLQANGWSKNPNNPDFNDELDFTNYLPISNVLTAMGLSTRTSANGNGGENTMVSWEHNRDVVVGGKQYWATQADFTNVYNPSQGVIIANFNYGSAYQIEEFGLTGKHPDIVPPPLKQWSDVVFLEYQAECQAQGKDMKNLKYIFHIIAQNPDTEYVIEQILGEGNEPPDWSERKIYSTDSDEGKAILATPNGNGAAWFLVQHQLQLGRKKVKDVSVFKETLSGDQYNGPCFVFEIEDLVS